MSAPSTSSGPVSYDAASGWTLASLAQRLGPMPISRLRFDPAPGSATEADLLAIRHREGRLYELIDGVLVEKTMGLRESVLTGAMIEILRAFVRPRGVGVVTTPDLALRISPGVVRLPDVAFISWRRLPDRKLPADPIPGVIPDLCIEVLSPSNTAEEMAAKRQHYFAAGVLLVWEIDPELRAVTVFKSPYDSVTLSVNQTLDGGDVLPGFSLSLMQLFAELHPTGGA